MTKKEAKHKRDKEMLLACQKCDADLADNIMGLPDKCPKCGASTTLFIIRFEPQQKSYGGGEV